MAKSGSLLFRLAVRLIGLVTGIILLVLLPLRSLGQRLSAYLLKYIPWYWIPSIPGLFALRVFRDDLRHYNLHDTEGASLKYAVPPYDASYLYLRSPEGTYDDLDMPAMGRTKALFGRNVPLANGATNPAGLLSPNPFDVSQRLMTREHFLPAETLNLLAAAWVQFQVHDWFHHPELTLDEAKAEGRCLKVPVAEHYHWPEGTSMTVPETPSAGQIFANKKYPDAPTRLYQNTETHWWDASQIYGSDPDKQQQLRASVDGKLRLGKNNLLPQTEGIDETGFNGNWWLGLSMFHNLFTLEHNAICDFLKAENSSWSDEQLFQTARLINAALIAKIHTLEWTPALLWFPTTRLALKANWQGLLGRWWRKVSDSDILSGIPGSNTDHHGVPYAMSEEFVAVYRMHSLLPDSYRFYQAASGEYINEKELEFIQGGNTRDALDSCGGLANAFYSFGLANPGAITLHNYPHFLQGFKTGKGVFMDLAAVDILRDRERGVPRYNEFRRLFHKRPLHSIEDITKNPKWRREISDLYEGDIEKVDLMVGLFSEHLPPGFAFSDTAFRVFILMASRRLKSDRFYTNDFTGVCYTRSGIEWVDENNLGTVLVRHFPELRKTINPINPFKPWTPAGRP